MKKDFFSCRARFDKVGIDGGEKKVSEMYLVDAIGVSDAEDKLTKEIAQFVQGEFDVDKCARITYDEVMGDADEEGVSFFELKASAVILDEKSGKEKKSTFLSLVIARSFDDAYNLAKKELSNGAFEFVIDSLKSTGYIEIIE